jgi:hypothetical protein
MSTPLPFWLIDTALEDSARARDHIEAETIPGAHAIRSQPREPSPFQVALVYVGLDDMDRAFEWLDRAIEARAWEAPMIKANPIFERIRSDPRFPALLGRIGLPD